MILVEIVVVDNRRRIDDKESVIEKDNKTVYLVMGYIIISSYCEMIIEHYK